MSFIKNSNFEKLVDVKIYKNYVGVKIYKKFKIQNSNKKIQIRIQNFKTEKSKFKIQTKNFWALRFTKTIWALRFTKNSIANRERWQEPLHIWTLKKQKLLLNAFFSAQLNYCPPPSLPPPLIWILHCRCNNRIKYFHGRCVRITKR